MTETAAEKCVVELAERLDIAGAEALHLVLEDALAAGHPISLNGSQVVKIDTAGIQVLGAFYEEAKKHHLDVNWVEPSTTVSEVFSFLGLGKSVGLNDQEQRDD